MTKSDEAAHAAEELIDLGAASTETRGGGKNGIEDGVPLQTFPAMGLSCD